MKNTQLAVAPDLSVPVAIAARTVFIAGTKGSGKTYTAGVLVEEMLDAGVHVVVLDPLGVWWGLRSPADGPQAPADAKGFSILILGGEHGDQPLLPSAGEIVADFVVRSAQSVVLDLSGFDSDAEQDRFVTAFLKRLFRLKSGDKAALHLVMDEADLFAPQQPQANQWPMVGAAKAIVTKARSRGLSMTMISQRPQNVSKACTDEADVVIAQRITGVRPAKAMREWVEQHAGDADVKAFVDTLPSLANGEAWVWSPQFLKHFGRHTIRRKRTYDSSRTPEPGEVARKPKAAAAVDLAKLTADMAAAAEQAKADDPKTLRATIAELERKRSELERQLASKSPATATAAPRVIERPVVTNSQIGRLEKLQEGIQTKVEAWWKRASDGINPLLDQLHGQREQIAELLRSAMAVNTSAAEGVVNPILEKGQTVLDRPPPALPAPPAAPADAATRVELNLPKRKIVDAYAWWHAIGVAAPARDMVSPLAGYGHAKSRGFTDPLYALQSAGLIQDNALTDAGRAAAEWPAPTTSLAAYHNRLKAVLPGPATKIFDALHAAGGSSDRPALAAACGYSHPKSRGFTDPLYTLSARRFVDFAGGVVIGTKLMYPEGLR